MVCSAQFFLGVSGCALSAAKVGCFYIGSVFVGALAYADDLVLIAPSATALRKCWPYVMPTPLTIL